MTSGAANAPPPGAVSAEVPSLPAPVLELTLPRGSIPRLLRHPASGLGPVSGSPGEAVTFTWHDTPDRALAALGNILCRDASGWMLEEVRPGPGLVGPPGGAARLIRSASSLEDLALPAADAVREVAAFTGTRYRAVSGPREVELLDGQVTATGTDHVVCRARLRGYTSAEAALLAEALPLGVPGEPLPALALRYATGNALPEPGRTRVAEGSVGQLASATFAGMATSVVFWCARAEAAGDAEAVHQARVSIRRLRSVLRLLGPAISCRDVDAVEEGLRTTFAKLGSCRDLDVFRQGHGADLLAALPDEPRLGSMLPAVERRRARAWADARRWLASPAWRSATVRLAAIAVMQPWTATDEESRRELLQGDALGFGRRALRRARRKVLATGAVEALPDEALHALRRRCKRLRYAAELFAPFFAAKPARRFLRRLAHVQDVMGRVNDSAVASALAAEFARGRHFAGGAVVGWTAATGLAARRDLVPAWKRFRRAEPFWH